MIAADALFFGAHPDDVELTSGGLAARLAERGRRVVVVDLTRGEMASRGDVETRAREAASAARELGVSHRESLGLPDTGLDRNDRAQRNAVIECLRRHRPELVVAPFRDDEHPDHVETSHLVERACYLAGLARYPAGGERHRPRVLLFALYRTLERPHLVVDVTPVWERRQRAIAAHVSQLGSGGGPDTYLTDPEFRGELEARARNWGAAIGVRYGEGYRARKVLGVADPTALLLGAVTSASGSV